jgi:hypothetical protein
MGHHANGDMGARAFGEVTSEIRNPGPQLIANPAASDFELDGSDRLTSRVFCFKGRSCIRRGAQPPVPVCPTIT